MIKKITILIFVFFLMGLNACEDLQDPPMDKDHTSLFVKLSDLPAEVEEVNVDILVVSVIIDDSIHSLFTNNGIYNLLDYAGEKDTIIASKKVPVGYLSQIRLVLGKNNSIKMGGEYYELKAPSASESGLKLNVQEQLYHDVTYTFVLDFIAEESIVDANDKYLLKPVIKVINETISGTIKGVVDPPEAGTEITAFSDLDTITGVADVISGQYVLRGLSAASYDLFFNPVEPWQDTTLYGIHVDEKQTVELDTLFLK